MATLKLNVGERVVLLSALPQQGSSSTLRKTKRVKRAVGYTELERGFSLAELRGVNDELRDVELDEDTLTWVCTEFTSKNDFAASLDEWVITLEEKLTDARMTKNVSDK